MKVLFSLAKLLIPGSLFLALIMNLMAFPFYLGTVRGIDKRITTTRFSLEELRKDNLPPDQLFFATLVQKYRAMNEAVSFVLFISLIYSLIYLILESRHNRLSQLRQVKPF